MYSKSTLTYSVFRVLMTSLLLIKIIMTISTSATGYAMEICKSFEINNSIIRTIR